MRLIYILLVLGLLSACGKKPAEMVIGKWKIEDLTAPEPNVPDSLREFYREQMEKQNAEMLSTGYYEFTKNGKGYFELSGQRNDGKWRVSEDGKFLYVKDDKSPSEVEFRIEELTNDVFTIETGEGNETVRLVMKKHFGN